MKINKILFALSVIVFSQSIFAGNFENQNTLQKNSARELVEPTVNARFTVAPLLTNSNSKEFGFATDFVINDNLMLGPQLSYHKYSAHMYDVSAYGIGFSMTYSLTENFDDGWFINPGAKLYSYKSKSLTSSDSSSQVPNDVISASLMYGYKWFFKDGFNVRFSAGLQYNSDNSFQEDNVVYDSSSISGYSMHQTELRGGSGLTADADISVGLIF